MWISCFDINYALMDKEVDRAQGIRSFPASYGEEATMGLSVVLTLGWLVCFLLTGIGDTENWISIVVMIAAINLYVVTKGASRSSGSADDMRSFQSNLFRASMLTGWLLLGSLVFIVH